ncbi:hypothetical protein GR268_47190 [Rhizobium leguminosarum]|nr:hypothetical protein [Rhizobium leguminosarum]
MLVVVAAVAVIGGPRPFGVRPTVGRKRDLRGGQMKVRVGEDLRHWSAKDGLIEHSRQKAAKVTDLRAKHHLTRAAL